MKILRFLALLSGIVSADAVYAQQTYEEMELLTVNEQVTTVITASEPIRFSSPKRVRMRMVNAWLSSPSLRSDTVRSMRSSIRHVFRRRWQTKRCSRRKKRLIITLLSLSPQKRCTLLPDRYGLHRPSGVM